MNILSLILFPLVSFLSQDIKPKAAPPGTIQVNENLFIDTEVMRNNDWKEFLFAVKQDSARAFYESMIPDTIKFVNGKNYFKNREFGNKPLTGITYNQAMAFCKWRSDLVSANIVNPEAVCEAGKPLYLKFDKAYKITYRLPKPEELKMLGQKSKKLKGSVVEEMTLEANTVVLNSFSKKAILRNKDKSNPLTSTFRCVAFFEKR